MCEKMENQVSMFDLDTSCGRTSPEPSPVTKAKTSASSLKKSQKSKTKMPLFLDLRNGKRQDASWAKGIPLLGGYWMPNGGECHSEEDVLPSWQTSTDTRHSKSCSMQLNTTESPNQVVQSHLSQILETSPNPKYNLSAKACQGILNRASRRGKQLPTMLREALEQMISTASMETN